MHPKMLVHAEGAELSFDFIVRYADFFGRGGGAAGDALSCSRSFDHLRTQMETVKMKTSVLADFFFFFGPAGTIYDKIQNMISYLIANFEAASETCVLAFQLCCLLLIVQRWEGSCNNLQKPPGGAPRKADGRPRIEKLRAQLHLVVPYCATEALKAPSRVLLQGGKSPQIILRYHLTISVFALDQARYQASHSLLMS